ncbi:TniB family NTP-binding protein [Alcanivorax sp.]|uniref:TniB family NTP-binding protein n=1 Tax=Alcanivorax sp. TaxID=1872427 RepID=UPI0025872D18|nr:TniB family NTP-binding protein [Alcanivorax sp.]
MSGDYGHIHPKFRAVALKSKAERIAFLDEPRWIRYAAADRIIDNLHGLLDKPKRPRMPNLLIVGEPNNGKTTIIRRFHSQVENEIDDEGEPVIPVILAESPPTADEKGLYISILEEFHSPYRATDPVSKMRYQVVHQFRYCHVRMLIVDEFHSLLTGSAIKQREVMNAIKMLCNTLAIPIVGVGTADAVKVLHTDPQHASRFDVVRLPRWEANQEFLKLLRSFERVLPLRKPSNLGNRPELAEPLLVISRGIIGNLHRLLIECAIEAIETGKECIDREIIERKKCLQPTAPYGIRELNP